MFIWGLYELSEGRNGVGDMVTLDEAKKKALEYIGGGLEICTVSELPGKWVFAFCDTKTKEEPDISPVMVTMEDGQTSVFFPPDHLEELTQME